MEKRWRRVTTAEVENRQAASAGYAHPVWDRPSCGDGAADGSGAGKSGGRGQHEMTAKLAAPDPLGWNLEPAADAVAGKRQFDLAAELIGQQFANDARAVARWVSGWHRRTAKFPPFEHQVRLRGAVRAPVPVDAHPS